MSDLPISDADVAALQATYGEFALTQGDIRIVVLDRGFVFVGRVTRTDTEMYIDDARCIRKWGTTEGLGQLAQGPLAETVLDAKCCVRPQIKAVLFTIDCVQSKWTAALA